MRKHLLLAVVSLAITSVVYAQEDVSVELAFVTHLDMDMPEQDAFIEREPGSGEVWRVTKGDHDMNAQLYRTAVEVEHNPFDPGHLGPYPQGEPLGITLGQWLKHYGTGKYSCKDGVGYIDLNFKGLIPNGVYSMWHFFLALPPQQPFTGALDLPLGARDGSESIFTANADGTASFKHEFTPCLQMSDVWLHSGLAIAYHSDGKTWGGDPGKFGKDSHVPIFLLLPQRQGLDATANAQNE